MTLDTTPFMPPPGPPAVWWCRLPPAQCDAVRAGLFVAVSMGLAFVFDAAQAVHRFAEDNARYRMDEFLFVLPLLVCAALAWYSLRRWGQARRELAARKVAERALVRREAILESISAAAGIFLDEGLSLPMKMALSLKSLGQAVDASRAYVFENHPCASGGLCMSQRFEWVADGVSVEIDNPAMQGLPYGAPGFEDWPDVLGQGRALRARADEFASEARAMLEAQGVKSLLVVPIQAEGHWWGFLGFDECRNPRDWDDVELEALQGAAALIGSALAQERLRRSSAETARRLSSIIASNLGLVFTATPTSPARTTYVSPNVTDILGYTPAEVLSSPHFARDVLHPDHSPGAMEQLVILLADGAPRVFEDRFRHKDGHYVWMRCRMVLVRDEHGAPQELVGMAMDVTDRVRAEEAVREREAFYREMFEGNDAVQLLVDPRDGRIVDANRAACIFYGYSRNALRALSIADINVVPRDVVGERLEGARTGALRNFESRHRLADGSVRDVAVHTGPVKAGGQTFLYTIIQDITVRRMAEKELRASSERFQSLFENAPIALWEQDFTQVKGLFDALRAQGVEDIGEHLDRHPDLLLRFAGLVRVVDVNQATLDLYRWSGKEQMPADLAGLAASDAFLESFRRELAVFYAGGRVYTGESRVALASGEVRNLIISSHILPGFEDTMDKVLVSALDITDRIRSEEALAEERALLRNILEAIPDPLFYKDIEGRYLGCNPAFGDEAHVVGRSDYELFPAEEAEYFRFRDALVLSQRRTLTSEQWVTFPGGRRLLEMHKTPLRALDGSAMGVVGIGRDVTMRKRLEEDLKRAKAGAEEANRAKGDFLANISHELRTPLNGILGMTEVALLEDLPEGSRQHLGTIRRSGRRLLRIVNDLLDFSRSDGDMPAPSAEAIRLRPFLEGLLAQVRPAAEAKSLSLELRLAADAPEAVEGDQALLGQMLGNLLENAVKFTDRGFCRLSAELLPPPDQLGRPARGRRVWLRFSVEDSGIGIDAATQGAIFEPFTQVDASYDRKQGGVGLGLAIAKKLARHMGGAIRVESTPGQGSTFVVECPFGEAAAKPLEPHARGVEPAAPTLAADEALQRLGGNQELFDRLLSIFRRETPETVERIEQALELDQAQEALGLAQLLKGRAATIAANSATELAARLEALLRTGEWEEARRLLPDLGTAVRQTYQAIEDRHTRIANRPLAGEVHP